MSASVVVTTETRRVEAPRLDRGEESRCQLVGGLATHPGKPHGLTVGRSHDVS